MPEPVVIKNVGCIKHLTIDIPEEGGGVLLLRGDNGRGKSTALTILRGLLAGSGKLKSTDGTPRGTVDGLGRHVSVSTQTKYSGSSDTPSLEGKFDFSDLVRPMAKDPEARDRIRTKALLGLTGVKADAALFYELVGGKEKLEEIVPPNMLQGDDLVELGGRVKRAIDAKAREAEAESSREQGYAKSLLDQAGDVDTKNVPDIEALRKESVNASSKLATLEERVKAAREAEEAIAEASRKLAEAKASYTGPTIEEAKEKAKLSNQHQAKCDERVADLKRQLAEIERQLQVAGIEAKAAADQADSDKEALDSAKSHVATIQALEAALNQAGPQDVPGEFDIMLAKQEADEAQDAISRAEAIRKAVANIQQAKVHQDRAAVARDTAERLRDAAKSVDDCLTKALPEGALRADGGRIVHDTPRGSGVLYDESSDGERWKDALPYGIKAVGKGGVLAVVQDAWQDLGPKAKAEIAEQAEWAGVWIITAEVTAGDLRAETFEPEVSLA